MPWHAGLAEDELYHLVWFYESSAATLYGALEPETTGFIWCTCEAYHRPMDAKVEKHGLTCLECLVAF